MKSQNIVSPKTRQNYFVYFFYNSFWAVWHLQSSPRSTPAVPVATLLGFNVHRHCYQRTHFRDSCWGLGTRL